MSRVERDHHYLCSTEKCVAPTPLMYFSAALAF